MIEPSVISGIMILISFACGYTLACGSRSHGGGGIPAPKWKPTPGMKIPTTDAPCSAVPPLYHDDKGCRVVTKGNVDRDNPPSPPTPESVWKKG